ncbi:beta-N-acetylhexosaminidase [Halorhodospira halophila]|uniref:beta-N-acetylhexosaminidase n=1 Tax=Halorhodospira halophila TaxID=1053 RepID=UPI0019140DC6|nr:beta-N-acetylhexosaminidase [Halorhodospira halophila]MBK5942287.1 beta-N-acetylhexosaminidase [Halorhodospira halophila]
MLGPLMIGIEGVELPAQSRELLRHPAVGGVVLFARNFQNVQQLHDLTRDIHAVREPPLLIAVDQEGGRVQRFREGFTPLPPASWLGRLNDLDPHQARLTAQRTAWVMAAELRACGVDLSFAPVLDLDGGISPVIGARALHGDPATVARLGHAWMRGMRQAGMAAVGKHFPGHGSVEADSHVALPCDGRPLAEIARRDLVPFQRLAAAGLPGIMAAHVVYPEVDDRPAGFSRRWIGDILRRRVGFLGAVFSDDLGMRGAETAGTMLERVDACLGAGCDAALVCDPPQAEALLGEVAADRWLEPASGLRMVRMHGRPAPAWSELQEDAAYQAAVRELTEGIPGFEAPG